VNLLQGHDSSIKCADSRIAGGNGSTIWGVQASRVALISRRSQRELMPSVRDTPAPAAPCAAAPPLERLPFRGTEHEPAKVLVDSAADDDLLPNREAPLQVGLVEPGGLNSASAVGERHTNHRHPSASALGFDVANYSNNRDLVAERKPVNRLQLREIVVPTWEVVKEVKDSCDSQAGQMLLVGRTDSFQFSYGQIPPRFSSAAVAGDAPLSAKRRGSPGSFSGARSRYRGSRPARLAKFDHRLQGRQQRENMIYGLRARLAEEAA